MHQFWLLVDKTLKTMLKMTKRKSQPIDIQLVDFLASWYQRELNQRHTDFQSVALPTELWYPFSFAVQKYNIF